jgi:uncharacterized coiled-coil DUF342 family protein
MTREEREDAIDIIQSILDKYEEDECLATEITIGDEDIKAFKMAIKALEQEPTDKNFTKADIDAIVKAINEGWELRVNEILDKIRAEISTVYESLDGYDPDSLGAFVSKIDEILDKYKTESERKE